MLDPDLYIRVGWGGGRGGRSYRPLYKGVGEGQSPQKIFSALRASVWSKTRRGGQVPGLSPGSATPYMLLLAFVYPLVDGFSVPVPPLNSPNPR